MNQDSEKIKRIISQFDQMIQCEMEGIQIGIKLIQRFQAGHLTLDKIIVKDARSSISESRERIKTWGELKRKWETKLLSTETTFTN